MKKQIRESCGSQLSIDGGFQGGGDLLIWGIICGLLPVVSPVSFT